MAVAAAARKIHAAWEHRLEAWRGAHLARDLDRIELAPFLSTPPTATTTAQVLAAHYHAHGDVVERAWRSQSDRYLELPDAPIQPEVVASAVHVILPEARIGIVRHATGLEVRLASDDSFLDRTPARVMLRRMERHARSGATRVASLELVDPRSFVYALNVMLEVRGAPVRFLPLVSLPDRRAWIATTLERALVLEDESTIASSERWREYCVYNDVVLAARAS